MSKQKLSLQEQLLKSGLVSAAKAKSANSEKIKLEKQQRKGNVAQVNDAKELALKSKLEKAEKDKLLNQIRQEQIEQKNKAAQIKQLIDMNCLKQNNDEGIAYRFSDDNKVKIIYVTQANREAIITGKMIVVKAEDNRYEMVAAEIADKIAQRDRSIVIVDNRVAIETKQEESDPYAEYQIPDDLIW